MVAEDEPDPDTAVLGLVETRPDPQIEESAPVLGKAGEEGKGLVCVPRSGAVEEMEIGIAEGDGFAEVGARPGRFPWDIFGKFCGVPPFYRSLKIYERDVKRYYISLAGRIWIW